MFEAIRCELKTLEVDGVDRRGLCERATGLAHLRAAVDAAEARVVWGLDALDDSGADAATVLRSMGRGSDREARRRARRAKALGELPSVMAALADGQITAEHVDVLARAAAATSADAVETSDLLDLARARPADLFARDTRTWLQRRRSTRDIDEKQRRQRQARRLVIFESDDEMVVIRGEFDPVTGAQIRAAIDAETNRLFEADGGRGEADSVRSFEQRRADATANLVTRRSGAGSGSRSPRNQVIVVAETGVISGSDPDGRCEIIDTGPIPRSELERLACDAEIFGLLFSADGLPLWHGQGVRTVTAPQWRALVARDGGCVMCGAATRYCEAHHVVPWRPPTRGPTNIDNLALLCTRHHHQVHDLGQTLIRGPDGTWTLPVWEGVAA